MDESEVDFDAVKKADYARGLKYGSFLDDILLSIKEGDMQQAKEDVEKLREYLRKSAQARRELGIMPE